MIPSIPGFGFSGPTHEKGWNRYRTARAWAALMRRLGYARYGTHGNDAGAFIAPRSAYAQLQRTTPQNLAHALADSPAGQLAWVAQLLGTTGDEHVLTNATIYWLTNTGASSARFHYEDHHAQHPTAPTGLASFAHVFTPAVALRRATTSTSCPGTPESEAATGPPRRRRPPPPRPPPVLPHERMRDGLRCSTIGRGSAPLQVPVGSAAVGNSQYQHDQFSVPDCVDDPVVSNADPPQVRVATECPAARRTWVLCQLVHCTHDAPGDRLVERAQLLERLAVVLDGVAPGGAHNSSIRAASSAGTDVVRPASWSSSRCWAMRPSSQSSSASYSSTSSAGTIAAAR